MEIDIGRQTCVDTSVDGVAVFTNMIIASQIVHEVRVAPDIGRPCDDRTGSKPTLSFAQQIFFEKHRILLV